MSTTSADSCADPEQKLLSVEQGRERILQAVNAVTGTEQLHIRAAVDRVLVETVVSNIDVPPFANSAMDGYAIRSRDCTDTVQTVLTVIGSSFAGAPYADDIGEGECIRIMNAKH